MTEKQNTVTNQSIDDLILSTDYHQFADTTVTVCCIHLTNGFTTTGTSACVDPANFDKEFGEKLAFDEARQKIWVLEGYLLNYKLNVNKNMAESFEAREAIKNDPTVGDDVAGEA